MLFEPARHEALCGEGWDEALARDGIDAIAVETERAFVPERYWPSHPRDFEDTTPERMSSLYFGAAGVLLALEALERRDFVRRKSDWEALARELVSSAPRAPDLAHRRPSLLLGESGLLFAAFRLAPGPEIADRLFALHRRQPRRARRRAHVGRAGNVGC